MNECMRNKLKVLWVRIKNRIVNYLDPQLLTAFKNAQFDVTFIKQRLIEKDAMIAEISKNLSDRLDEVVELRKRLAVKPTIADLMRDSIGLPLIDYDGVDRDGYPPHPTEGMSKKARATFMGELSNIYNNEAFQSIMTYWINTFGNHAVRNVEHDPRSGQFGINGIAMIRKELRKGYKEVLEASKPEEEVDQDELIT